MPSRRNSVSVVVRALENPGVAETERSGDAILLAEQVDDTRGDRLDAQAAGRRFAFGDHSWRRGGRGQLVQRHAVQPQNSRTESTPRQVVRGALGWGDKKNFGGAVERTQKLAACCAKVA